MNFTVLGQRVLLRAGAASWTHTCAMAVVLNEPAATT
jgi:hypothetical protein